MTDWEPNERRPREPMDDAGSDLPPTEPIPGQGEPPVEPVPGQGGTPEDLPIVPMSDEEPLPPPAEPIEPEAVEPEAFEPTMVVPPTGPPPGGPPLTPGGPPPPDEPWYRRPGPLAAVIGVGLALIFLLVAFLIWVSDDDGDDRIATSDSSTSSTSSTSTTSTTVVSTTTTEATTTSSSTTTTSSSTSSTSSTTTTTEAPATTQAPTTTAAPTTTTPPPTTTIVPAVTVPPAPDTTLWDIVRASPDLSRLEELVQQAGLVDAVDAADPITLFAPSNAAFELLELAPGGSDLLEDTDQLRDLLLGHVVEGQALTADELFDLDSIEVGNGEVWTIEAVAQTIDGAGLPVVDVEGANGLLHVVDRVLGT